MLTNFRMLRTFHTLKTSANLCTKPASKLVDSLASTIDGLDRETLVKLFDSAPQLTRYVPELWQRTHQLMTQEGFQTANFLSIVTGHPELLTRHPDRLASSLDCWRSCQFGDKQTQVLLAAHPQLLDFTDHNQLAQRVAFLHSYFETRRNVWRLLLNSPNLVPDSQTSIQPKIDYILQKMRIEVPEVVRTCAFAADLDKIRCRHVFLERLGLFKPRSLKADPGDPNDNPKLHQITDTTDKRFAVKVAFVTLEEYEVFMELFHKDGGCLEDDYEDQNGVYDEDYLGGHETRKKSYRKGSKRSKSS